MLTADGRHVSWGGEPARQRSNQSIAVSLLFIANFKSFRSFPLAKCMHLACDLNIALRQPFIGHLLARRVYVYSLTPLAKLPARSRAQTLEFTFKKRLASRVHGNILISSESLVS